MNYLKITIINKFLYQSKMLYYDRIAVSEGIDINKTSASKESGICHYWFFLDKEFKFQQHVYKECHDIWIMYIDLNDIAILGTKGADYRWIIDWISKNDFVNALENADKQKERSITKDKKIIKDLLPYIKCAEKL